MARIHEETIDTIKQQADIVSIISEYVDLKKAGSNYIGLCPFHNEKTPSFSVSPTKGIFKCFGCGEGGDVVSFVRKKEGLNYPESIRFLADKLGILIESDNINPEIHKKRSLLYEINNEARLFYYQSLLTNSIPKEYLKNRGLDKKCINYFFLGYADSSWDSLYIHLKKQGYQEADLLELGLIRQSKHGKFYDTFRNRLIFPILDIRKKVLAFGGRTLGDDKAKYINSKESLIYQKRKNLYGTMNLQSISKANKSILVEGYLDVISLYNRGIDIAVATLGTALTEDQAKFIQRYTKNIYIAYDGDEAGINAAEKGIDVFGKIGMEPKIIIFPEKMDPDDYINSHGKENFENLVDNSYIPFLYRYDIIKSRYDLKKIEERIKIQKEIIELIAKEKSPLKRNEYIDFVVEDMQIEKTVFQQEIEYFINTKSSIKAPIKQVEKTKKKNNQNDKITNTAIKFMINQRKYNDELLKYEEIFSSSSIEYKEISQLISDFYNEHIEMNSVNENYVTENQILQDFVIDKEYSHEELGDIFQNLCYRLEYISLMRDRQKIKEEINLLSEQGYDEMSENFKEKYRSKLQELLLLERQIRR